mmetsp:Transcript_100478/g.292896  ORF Transcript_100478/g.292896 Transcript_100478/m.292896 type:complete len:206 (+) Transcript_100478:1184-1801(+)
MEGPESLPFSIHGKVKGLAHIGAGGVARNAATPEARLVVYLQAANCRVWSAILALQARLCTGESSAALACTGEAAEVKFGDWDASLAVCNTERERSVEKTKGLSFTVHEIVKGLTVSSAVGVTGTTSTPDTRLTLDLETVGCGWHGAAIAAAQAGPHILNGRAACSLVCQAGDASFRGPWWGPPLHPWRDCGNWQWLGSVPGDPV